MKKMAMYMAEKYTENGLINKDKYGDWCVPIRRKRIDSCQRRKAVD